MRLWHTRLIEVLPREQLVAQWRELSAIVGTIQKNGTPNHILVNFVLDYDWDDLISYAYYVRQEMTKRGYRTTEKVWEKIKSLKENYKLIPLEQVYSSKMNKQYFIICCCNLLEKYLCRGINEEDMTKIYHTFLKVVDGENFTQNYFISPNL